ncbi:MAG: NAD(+) synthase [Thermodesulfobacterium sp.]|jgi:NAD+ synthase (glutamine-hydrolysing)|nr:NAD(+) synthase [Thermodesulfobacterium sp.]
MKDLKIGIAQLNPTCGDLSGNLEKVKATLKELSPSADLVVFSFLPLTGYPLLSLAYRKDFLKDCKLVFEELVKYSKDVKAPFLFTHLEGEGAPNLGLFLIEKGEVIRRAFSSFDQSESLFLSFSFNSMRILSFVEGKELNFPPDEVDLFLILSKRPYYFEEEKDFLPILKDFVVKHRAFVFYVREAYVQDEYIFPGKSLVLSPKGEIIHRAKAFDEELMVVPTIAHPELPPTCHPEPQGEGPSAQRISALDQPLEKEDFSELYQALVFALKNYARKTGFYSAILGLSGGIDSSLVATLAVDALGKEGVKALFMPSAFTSQESREDAYALAKNLGIGLTEIPIQEIFNVYRQNLLSGSLPSDEITLADENLQARIRANLLFYLSNKENHLVLCTSNKSEAATGYGTIYGDIAGGYAPIKDVYKTWVYELARYRNLLSPVIPERIFSKAPSAELRPGQRDEDELPPYSILDAILRAHLEEGLMPEEILQRGFSEEHVKKTFRMLARAEYKRRQAPLGPKVTKSALGIDYRLPIMLKFQSLV